MNESAMHADGSSSSEKAQTKNETMKEDGARRVGRGSERRGGRGVDWSRLCTWPGSGACTYTPGTSTPVD